MVDMSNYLFAQKSSGAGGKSTYGSIHFNRPESSATNSLSNFEYICQLNGSAMFGLPAYANMANNMILKNMTGNSAATISLSMVSGPQTDAEKGEDKTSTGIVLAFFLIIAFSIVPATFVYEQVKEVNTKAKHQQFISGCKPIAYWGGTFCWDFLYYCVPMWLTIALLLAFTQEQFYKADQFAPLVVIFAAYGLASISLSYCLTFFFKDENQALMSCIFGYVFSGFILFLVSWVLSGVE